VISLLPSSIVGAMLYYSIFCCLTLFVSSRLCAVSSPATDDHVEEPVRCLANVSISCDSLQMGQYPNVVQLVEYLANVACMQSVVDL